ncbi:MAG: MFS transporter [Thermoleophilia bacterium]|nr:MFS transporter [Thermoleophilia bacterium]MDH4345247.1 MFS transporter [Thermoleophilia bacterium]
MRRSARVARRRVLRSLRRRNYRLFFVGQIVSLAGTWMQNVALAWLAITLSGGDPLAVAGMAFCRFLPFTLLALVAGAVVDRVDAWKLVAVTQAAAMAVSAALAGVVLSGTSSLPLVYVLAALGGVALVFDAPARQALVYRMVGPASLANAVALNSGLFNAARVVGPALAGVTIAALGVGACFVVNAVSFLAVLAALALMRRGDLLHVEQRHTAFGAGIRESVAYALRTPDLRTALGVVVVTSVIGFNFHIVIPLLAADTLRAGPGTLGLLSGAFGAGAVSGALATAVLGRASWRAFLGGAGGFAVGMLILAPVHQVALAGGVLFGIGFAFTLFTASANAIVQLAAPGELRGRLIALYLFAFAGLAPVGSLLSGWLVDVGGTALAFATAGTVGLVATGVAAGTRVTAPLRAEAPVP